MESGLLIEFDTTERLLEGLRRLHARERELGIRELDAFTPWPVEEVEKILELPKSRVSLCVLLGGLAGAAIGYVIQWWCNAINYSIDVGGRPPHAAPAFVLITFETMVLVAGLTALVSLLVFARLPRLWDPVFEVDAFRRASVDRFWIGVERGDAELDVDGVRLEMAEVGALQVVLFGEAR